MELWWFWQWMKHLALYGVDQWKSHRNNMNLSLLPVLLGFLPMLLPPALVTRLFIYVLPFLLLRSFFFSGIIRRMSKLFGQWNHSENHIMIHHIRPIRFMYPQMNGMILVDSLYISRGYPLLNSLVMIATTSRFMNHSMFSLNGSLWIGFSRQIFFLFFVVHAFAGAFVDGSLYSERFCMLCEWIQPNKNRIMTHISGAMDENKSLLVLK